MDADDPPIADRRVKTATIGLVNFEPVHPADNVHDDRYLITGVIEARWLNPVGLPGLEELAPEPPHARSKPL